MPDCKFASYWTGVAALSAAPTVGTTTLTATVAKAQALTAPVVAGYLTHAPQIHAVAHRVAMDLTPNAPSVSQVVMEELPAGFPSAIWSSHD